MGAPFIYFGLLILIKKTNPKNLFPVFDVGRMLVVMLVDDIYSKENFIVKSYNSQLIYCHSE